MTAYRIAATDRPLAVPVVLVATTLVAAFGAGTALTALGAAFSPVAMVVPPVALVVGVVAFVARHWAIALFFTAVPLATVSTPLPVKPIVAAAGSVVVVVVLAGMAKARSPLGWHPSLLWGVVLLVAALVAVPGAADVNAAAKQVLQLVAGLVLASATLAAVKTQVHLRHVVNTLLAVGAGVALHALVTVGELRASFAGGVVEGRATGVFGHPNDLGAFSAVVLLVAAGSFVGSDTLSSRLGAALPAVLSALALALSLSRGAWLGAALGFAALFVLAPSGRTRRVVVAIPLVAGGALLVALQQDTPETAVLRQRIVAVSDRGANPYDQRPAIYREAWRQVGERPFTGYGPGSFPTVSARPGTETQTTEALHAHNVLLTVAAELGVPAALVLASFTLSVGFATMRALRSAGSLDRRAGLLAGLGAALFTLVGQGMVDYVFREQTLVLLSWALVGLTLAGCRMYGLRPGPSGDLAAQSG